MNRRWVIVAVAAWLSMSIAARAVDTIKTAKTRMTGEITAMSPLRVVIKRKGVSKEYPVNEIVAILYEGEPAALNLARSAIAGGRLEDALKTLEKIKSDDVDRETIKQDIEFYKAYCAARLALAGTGEIRPAGSNMVRFVESHPGSYHWLKANEVVGELLMASGLYDRAVVYYSKVARAPWPECKMRALVAIGRARLAQGKPDEAVRSFEEALGIKAADPAAGAQRQLAALGKARCLAATKKYDEAIRFIEDIIAKADPEQVELHAQAYNALGAALRKAGRTEEALLAFLHVDVLYFAVADAHAEALANLAELWNDVHKPDQALRAQQTLHERYKNSRWARGK
jgi:tetratricopeptide (TPR) repeat protein